MRMVRCYECGKQYDYDDDGFCPKCGAFNQPARASAAARRAAAGTASEHPASAREKRHIQRDMEDNLRQMEKAMKDLLGGKPKPRGRRLPGGHL